MSQEMVRKLDELGRVVLPKEVRDLLGWPEKTPLAIHVNPEEQTVTLQKCQSVCLFCGAAENLKEFHHKFPFVSRHYTLCNRLSSSMQDSAFYPNILLYIYARLAVEKLEMRAEI